MFAPVVHPKPSPKSARYACAHMYARRSPDRSMPRPSLPYLPYLPYSPSPFLPSLHCCTGESVVRTFCRHAPVRLLRLRSNCNVCEVLREAWHAHPLGVVRRASFSDLAPITMSRRCPCSCSRLRAAPLQLCTTAPLDIHLHATISQPVD